MVFSGFPGLKKDCSQALGVCYFGVLVLGQQLLKYTDKLLSGKDWQMGIFACSLCTKPWSNSSDE